MLSVVFNEYGDPAKVLRAEDRPPPAPGPGQIRVKMRLSPIHNHDLWTVRGEYGVKPPLPAIGGSEALGLVDALGAGVEGLAVGQRITTASAVGAWAEYFLVSAKAAVPLPDFVSDEVGCQICAMPLSAVMALDDLGVQPGQWMIQNAATGAVGKTLAMLAKARGVRVINVVRREAAIAELAALGIGDAVSTSDPNWRKAARALTGGAPIVAALDSVGGEESGQLLHLLGEGGQLMTFGAMANQPMIVSPGDLIFKQATINGFWAYKRIARTSGADMRRMIGELVRLAATGELKLTIEKELPARRGRRGGARQR